MNSCDQTLSRSGPVLSSLFTMSVEYKLFSVAGLVSTLNINSMVFDIGFSTVLGSRCLTETQCLSFVKVTKLPRAGRFNSGDHREGWLPGVHLGSSAISVLFWKRVVNCRFRLT